MQATHPDIPDPALLHVLGDILRPSYTTDQTSLVRLALLRPGFRWEALTGLADDQGVLLPLVQALTARSLAPPIPRAQAPDSHVSVRLANVWSAHLGHRQRQIRQMQDLLAALDRARITPLLLKGMRYLADPVGPWGVARTMGDFDILVRPADTDAAHDALVGAGYRRARHPETPYRAAHHLPPLDHPDHPMSVEIHVEALTAAASKLLDTTRIWHRAVQTRDGNALLLPPVWQALHGLLHHQVQDRGHHLHKLCVKGLWEWTMLVQGLSRDDWSLLRDHMTNAGAVEILDSWCWQAHGLFALEPPWLSAIGPAARDHADRTLRRAVRPYWRRRLVQVDDELRVSFARESLAERYGLAPADISLTHVGRYLRELAQRHRGGVLRRLTGSGGSP